jgi:oligopeptide/dipeptide ABC transporter ATP-binding protein
MTALSIMRVLPSVFLPSNGQILFQGEDLLALSEAEMRAIRGSRIAMIFQDPTSALNPVYTVGDQLIESVNLHLKLDEDESRQHVLAAMEEVGVPSPVERFDEYPHQLSGGLKQRVMIAMALACRPAILIADEPTTALDVTIQAQVLELIRQLQAKNGMSQLLITHDMGVVAEMAQEVIVMYASQAIEKGSVFDIFDHMGHPYTKGLFDSRPQAKSRRGSLVPIKGQVPSLTHYPAGCRFHPRCPYAMEKCRHGPVPDFAVGGNTSHISKCWLHDGSPESAQKLLQVGGLHADASA